MLKQLFVGLIIAGFGGVISYFSQSIADSFGRVDWFERTFSSTRNGYVILGFIVIVVGFLILFGVLPLTSGIT